MKKVLSLWMLVLAAMVLVPLASADTITLSLASPVQSGAAGSTVSFIATINAVTDKLGTVYLNGDSANISGASSLVVDDTGFWTNFPASMNGGDSVTDVLFTVDLPSDVIGGTYTGYFSILGGLDASTLSVLDTAQFTINATGANPIPEPATWSLLATGIGVLGMSRRRLFGRV